MSRRLITNRGTEAVSELTVDEGLPRADFRVLHADLLGYGGYARKLVPSVAAGQLTEEAVRHSALAEPLLVPAAPAAVAELGMMLPAEPLTPDRVASQLGPNYEVRTFDVPSQVEGPHWTLHQWNLYWEARRPLNKDVFVMPPPKLTRVQPTEDEADSAAVARKRTADSDVTGQVLKGITFECKKRLLEVLQLSMAGTPLEAHVQPPIAVRAADLLTQAWPTNAPYRPHTSAFLAMSPAGSYTDFRLPGGGSGLWCHVVSGARTFALCPPSPRNLATYAAWASAARHSAVFLPPHCEGVLRVDVKAGDTLIIPPGWMHAAATTAASVMVAGNFLLRDSLALHLEAWRIEEHLGVHPRARYPLFKQLMWYTAAHYVHSLQALAGLSQQALQERAAQVLAGWAEGTGAEAAPAARQGAPMRADSDSVMGTSKAGTTTQRRAGAPASTIRDDACNQPPKQAQPGLSAGNRSIVLQRKLLAQAIPAVNSRPVPAAAAAALAPSAAAVAIARGELKLSGSKRRRAMNDDDSFIASDESGRAAASDEHDWQPTHECGSEEEEVAHSEGEEELDKDELGGSGPMAVDHKGEEEEALLLSSAGPGMRSQLRRLRRAGDVPAAAPSPLTAVQQQQQQQQGGSRAATRFRGNLPPKLAAMLHSLSGGDSPPHTSGGSAANHNHSHHHHNHHQHDQQQQQQQHLYADTATTASAHKPIRLKVKLRPLEQPVISGGGGGANTSGARTPGSATAFGHPSPRKLILKISKAATPRSPPLGAGSARAQASQNHVPEGCVAKSPGPAQLSGRPPLHPPAAAAVMALPADQLPLQLQQPRVEPAIPQVDGAFDEEAAADNDSTAAAGTPPLPPQQQEQQQQRQRQDDLGDGEEVVQGCREPLEAGESQQVPGQEPALADAAAVGSGSSPARSLQGKQQQQRAVPSRTLAAAAAAAPPRSNAVQDEFARMYAELEGQQLDEVDAGQPAQRAQPAESGGSVGGAGSGRAPQGAMPAASTGVAAEPPSPQQHRQQQSPQQPPAEAQPQPSPPQEQAGVSAVEAEGLAALLAVLKKWVVAHNALNDVPLSIKSPKEVLASLEVCMHGLGLPLIPPPPVDLDAVPLDRLRPRRPAAPAGTAATAGGSKRPRSLQTVQASEFEAELETGEEAGESMGADFNVVVEESTGPGSKLDAAGGRQPAKAQLAGRGAKKLSVKKSLMKKLHIK